MADREGGNILGTMTVGRLLVKAASPISLSMVV